MDNFQIHSTRRVPDPNFMAQDSQHFNDGPVVGHVSQLQMDGEIN